MTAAKLPEPGAKFGRWTFVERDQRQYRRDRWMVKCECGLVCSRVAFTIRHGTSEGCFECHRKRAKEGTSHAVMVPTWKAFVRLACSGSL